MPARDPFPMSSPEARRLAESTNATAEEGTTTTTMTSWNQMATGGEDDSRRPSPSHYDDHPVDEMASQRGLVRHKEYDEDQYEQGDDEFLDRPLHENRVDYILRQIQNHFWNIYHRLYGDQLPLQEMVRVLTLASTLFFMIGGYWLLRSLKDPVLSALCGVDYIPKAKILSVFVVLAVVPIYNHFLDSGVPKHQLFYIFGTFYFGLFVSIALLLMHPTIGLANENASPYRVLGWVSYCSIESFGSVLVSLFWSFANSNISLESAKASYGVMVASAQVGSIIGPTIVNRFATRWGLDTCYMLGACCMLLLQGTMYMYIQKYGAGKGASSTKKKEKTGVLEGVHLFIRHNYIKGIFAISCLFMVEVTIVDYTLKRLARDHFSESYPCGDASLSCWKEDGNHAMSQEATRAFAEFMGFFGQATNSLSLILSLFGTSAVIRIFGLRLTLLLFPSVCLCVIICVRLRPTLYVAFGAVMALKACSYALNNPTKEILYQPTSSSVKYKAKSWIDIFGARGSKAMGSLVTNAFANNAAALVANGSFVGMAVSCFLIWNARFMGKTFDEYMSTGYIVGSEDDNEEIIAEDGEGVELSEAQGTQEDTSCAIPDEDEGPDDKDAPSGKPEVAMV